MKLNDVLKIASAVRSEMETLRESYPGIFGKQLACMCAIASWTLTEVSKKLGYDVEFCVGTFDPSYAEDECLNHCWVMFQCRTIIDVTATQFSSFYDKVHVTRSSDAIYKIVLIGGDARKESREWGDQSPYTYSEVDKIVDRLVKKFEKE